MHIDVRIFPPLTKVDFALICCRVDTVTLIQ
jgi:hypothetical protein